MSVIDEFFVDRMYRSVEYLISNIKYPIIDIGAHIGVFSLYASVLCPKSNVLALEPEPSNFQLLKENLRLNKIKNVTPIKSALIACKESKTELYLSTNTHNHSTNKPINQSTSITVPATNLEKIIKQHKLSKIGILKMDIEGAEFQIISNIQYPIFDLIQNMVIEYHETEKNKRADLENTIRSHGFSVEHFPNHFDKKLGLLIARNKRK